MKNAILEIHPGKASLFPPGAKPKTVTIVVNTRQTLLRTVNYPYEGIRAAEEWELMQTHFPMGRKINQETHVFDYTVYENSVGKKMVLLAALPLSISEKAIQEGLKVVKHSRHITNIDIAENTIFKKFTANPEESSIIFLPQENSTRLLAISAGLPIGVFAISNHPAFRQNEFHTFYRTLQYGKTPRLIVLAGEESKPEYVWTEGLAEGGAAEFVGSGLK